MERAEFSLVYVLLYAKTFVKRIELGKSLEDRIVVLYINFYLKHRVHRVESYSEDLEIFLLVALLC